MQNRIKEFRKRANLSQQKLADMSGTTAATIMKLEKGDMQLTTVWIERISAALRINPLDLISPGTVEKIYKADENLMQQCIIVVMIAANANERRLKPEEMVAYTVKLYNHVMEYRSKGENISPSESLAIKIFRVVAHINSYRC